MTHFNQLLRRYTVVSLVGVSIYLGLGVWLTTTQEGIVIILISAVLLITIIIVGRIVINKLVGDYQRLFRLQKRLIDNANEAIAFHEVIWNDDKSGILDYRFLSVNRGFEKSTGLSSDAVVGKRLFEVLPNTERHWLETYGDVVINQKSTSFVNYTKGLDKYFKVVAYPVDKDKFATMFIDITDKLTQESTMNKALKNAEKANEFKNQFLKDVNHKLRTPLNGMMGIAQLIAMEPLESGVGELVAVMMGEMHNSRNILNQIAEYINLKDENYQITKNDLSENIESVLALSQEAIDYNIEFK